MKKYKNSFSSPNRQIKMTKGELQEASAKAVRAAKSMEREALNAKDESVAKKRQIMAAALYEHAYMFGLAAYEKGVSHE